MARCLTRSLSWKTFCWLVAGIAWFCAAIQVSGEPRAPQVAGQFYPEEPAELRELIRELLGRQPEPVLKQKVRVLIVPHAGYQYSGLIAANAFRQLQGVTYDGVVVVGFTHRLPFDGPSVDTRESYQTPLGEIPVHQEAVAILQTYPGIGHVEEAHESGEHSLEVELPFLQVVLGQQLRIVPVLMGGSSLSEAQRLARGLAKLAQLGDYLFVFSTDLSHYHDYDEAEVIDDRTISAILGETPQAVDRLFAKGQLEACGRGPILTSLLLAKHLGYPTRQLLYRANSGDTWGPPTRVVGYAAIAMLDQSGVSSRQLSPEAGNRMVRAARLALNMQLNPAKYKNRQVSLGLDGLPELAKARGVFVTLRKHGALRGCIGRIQASEPLAKSVPVVALDAALRDPRFPPVSAEELPELTIEVSVLTTPKKISDASEVVPGRDGVILEKDGQSGVFLPQVWDETGWTRVEFLRELASQKAGLPPDAWQQATLFTFQDQFFEESGTAVGSAH